MIIVVTDSGAGLSKENQAQVFQEGMQFNPECKTGGGSGAYVPDELSPFNYVICIHHFHHLLYAYKLLYALLCIHLMYSFIP